MNIPAKIRAAGIAAGLALFIAAGNGERRPGGATFILRRAAVHA